MDDKEITVKELRVVDILEIFSGAEGAPDSMAHIEKYIPRCFEGVKIDDLKEMAPSEIKELFEVFKEVNAVFFDLALEMGLAGVIEEIKKMIQMEFSGTLAGLSKMAMPGPSSTASAIS
jgi:hypothetical protein